MRLRGLQGCFCRFELVSLGHVLISTTLHWFTPWDTGDSFWLYGCANTTLNKFPLHVPKPQSKHTFIFTAATHKQRSNMAAVAPHVGNNWRSEAVCLAGCTNLECISMSAEAELQRSADENTREHKHRVLHSACTVQARYRARHSARPQNAVNTMGSAPFWTIYHQKKAKHISGCRQPWGNNIDQGGAGGSVQTHRLKWCNHVPAPLHANAVNYLPL